MACRKVGGLGKAGVSFAKDGGFEPTPQVSSLSKITPAVALATDHVCRGFQSTELESKIPCRVATAHPASSVKVILLNTNHLFASRLDHFFSVNNLRTLSV